MSAEVGVEGYLVRNKPIVRADMVRLLQDLGEKGYDLPVAIFLDNLRLHYTKDVVEAARILGWERIYNAPYSSSFHCIEEAFSQVKRLYKRQLVESGFQIKDWEHRQIVSRAIRSLGAQSVRVLAGRHLHCMRDFLS